MSDDCDLFMICYYLIKFKPLLLIKLKVHVGLDNEKKVFDPLSRYPEVRSGEEGDWRSLHCEDGAK